MKTYNISLLAKWWSDPVYASAQFSFAFVSAPDPSGIVRLRSYFATCREGFNETARKAVSGEQDKVPVKRARLAIMMSSGATAQSSIQNTRDRMAASLKQAVKLINMMERKHHWSLTKLYSLTHDRSQKAVMFMVVGDNNWIRSPHMVSMYILMLRSLGQPAFSKVNSVIELVKACKAVGNSAKDATYLHATASYWDSIMDKFHELFDGLSMSTNYNGDSYKSNSPYGEGIYMLCSGKSSHSTLAPRFRKLCQAR